MGCYAFLWVIEYQRHWMCNYIDTHRYNIGQITQCRLVQNVQNMCISSSNPDPRYWWVLLPLGSHATLCLWAPLGHFPIKAPTDFVPTSLVERSPLFFTQCAPLTAYMFDIIRHCGGKAYTQSYRTTRPDLCHHTNLSTVRLLLRLLRCVSLGNGGERKWFSESVAPPSWIGGTGDRPQR